MADEVVVLTNARLCRNGRLTNGEDLAFSPSTGQFLDPKHYGPSTNRLDMGGLIIAPGFLELQTNGMRGFHFTHLDDEDSYAGKLREASTYLPQTGVTGYYPTIPTVHSDEFKKILPLLKPQLFDGGASILGAHAEGPYLHPSKKGAHNASLFHQPSTAPSEIYGQVASSNETLKIVTLAPELGGTPALVKDLTSKGIRVSLGHSSATYAHGLAAVKAGATCLTHTLNAMTPLHHRDPGLAGLVTATAEELDPHSTPYFSIIPDGNHLHPAIASMLFHANPEKCIVITDSIEMAGLPDGTYPGHAQIPHNQTKVGTKVVIEGTDTLIGGCAGLDECVRNVIKWSGCSVAEAVRCVTENVASLMGLQDRGRLNADSRADFVVLADDGQLQQTWVAGKKVWEK